MLKKFAWILAAAVLGLAAFWLGGLSLLNTHGAHLQVRVSGAVDEVRIFRSSDPVNPVAVIETGGSDTTRVIDLRTAERFSPFVQSPPAAYFFTARQDDQVYQGSKICCETGFLTRESTLSISGLSAWEIRER